MFDERAGCLMMEINRFTLTMAMLQRVLQSRSAISFIMCEEERTQEATQGLRFQRGANGGNESGLRPAALP